jgi:hypothetical protein
VLRLHGQSLHKQKLNYNQSYWETGSIHTAALYIYHRHISFLHLKTRHQSYRDFQVENFDRLHSHIITSLGRVIRTLLNTKSKLLLKVTKNGKKMNQFPIYLNVRGQLICDFELKLN